MIRYIGALFPECALDGIKFFYFQNTGVFEFSLWSSIPRYREKLLLPIKQSVDRHIVVLDPRQKCVHYVLF